MAKITNYIVLIASVLLQTIFILYLHYRLVAFYKEDTNYIYRYRTTIAVGRDYSAQSATGLLICKKLFGYKFIIINKYENKKFETLSMVKAINEINRISELYNLKSIPFYTFCTIDSSEITKLSKTIVSENSNLSIEYNNPEYTICTCGSDGLNTFPHEDFINYILIKMKY